MGRGHLLAVGSPFLLGVCTAIDPDIFHRPNIQSTKARIGNSSEALVSYNLTPNRNPGILYNCRRAELP